MLGIPFIMGKTGDMNLADQTLWEWTNIGLCVHCCAWLGGSRDSKCRYKARICSCCWTTFCIIFSCDNSAAGMAIASRSSLGCLSTYSMYQVLSAPKSPCFSKLPELWQACLRDPRDNVEAILAAYSPHRYPSASNSP